MAKVRVRPETGNLYLDFQWRGMRCREQTLLPDNAQNRKTLESLATRIKRDIAKGSFDYRSHFPNSPRAAAFDASTAAPVESPSNEASQFPVLTFAQAAVSYTQLEVYKSQPPKNALARSSQASRANLSTVATSMVGG